jgi:hypothetical protein
MYIIIVYTCILVINLPANHQLWGNGQGIWGAAITMARKMMMPQIGAGWIINTTSFGSIGAQDIQD